MKTQEATGITENTEPTVSPPSPAGKPLNDDLRILRIDRSRKTTRKKSGTKWGLVLVVVAALAVVAYVATSVDLRSRFGGGAKEVSVVVATRRSPGDGAAGAGPVLSAGGYIIARNKVEVGSKITGRVVSLEVKEGDFVQLGQVTARLDDQEVTAQVRQAEAKLAVARSQLVEAQAGARPQEVAQQSAEVARVAADLKNAEQSLRRTETLAREGIVARQEVDDAVSRHQMALSTYRAAQKREELVRVGPRQESVKVAHAIMQQAAADLSYAKAQFENVIIRAPMTGIVLERYVDVGTMVTTGFTSDRGAKQALLSIANMNDLQVEANVSEADIAKVQIGQPASMSPDAYSDRQYKGNVEYIASTADRDKATVKVKINVLSPDGLLRPNMGAKVTFYQTGTEVPEGAPSVMVPKGAVVNVGGHTVVFLSKDEKAVMQRVEVGGEADGYVQILSGLQGGESVILTPGVADGDKIIAR
jgi:HlyD family secretion protein